MMRPAKVALLLVMIVVALACLSLSVGGEASDFIIENADGSRTVTFTGSSMLNDLIGVVLPRFTLEFVDGNRTQPLAAPPAALRTLVDNLAPRFTLEFADSNRFRSMTYPAGLIDDHAPPQISNPVTNSAGGAITFTWATNEPAVGRVDYGTQPGQLDQSHSETLFATQHLLTISGLASGQKIYYRLSSVDRSGNTAQTTEQSITIAQGATLYLPSVIR